VIIPLDDRFGSSLGIADLRVDAKQFPIF
jgi:hypothetical protein